MTETKINQLESIFKDNPPTNLIELVIGRIIDNFRTGFVESVSGYIIDDKIDKVYQKLTYNKEEEEIIVHNLQTDKELKLTCKKFFERNRNSLFYIQDAKFKGDKF